MSQISLFEKLQITGEKNCLIQGLPSSIEKQFIKLAIKFPLQSWNDIPSLIDKAFEELIKMLKY